MLRLTYLAVAFAITPDVDFNRDVLPILANNCFQCHGPDQQARKAKLRLDTKDGLRVVTPGRSADSELYNRITSGDETEVMPPPQSKKKLTPQQIDVLKSWIDQGAKWAKHWSFEPPRRPDLPAVRHKAWPRNAIDFFVLNRLEREGLQPSPEAAREECR